MKKLLNNDYVCMIILTVATVVVALLLVPQQKTISPIQDNNILDGVSTTPTPTLIPVPKPAPTKKVRSWKGTASYYSRAGCLGCSASLTMRNGEPLDDSQLTLAMSPDVVTTHNLLNKIVTVRNTQTGTMTQAKVTDTGGFARHNRIADLSVATKHALACRDLCEVEIVAD